jgi:hypothetical protein
MDVSAEKIPGNSDKMDVSAEKIPGNSDKKGDSDKISVVKEDSSDNLANIGGHNSTRKSKMKYSSSKLNSDNLANIGGHNSTRKSKMKYSSSKLKTTKGKTKIGS